MKRERGLVNVSALLGIVGISSLVSLDLVAIRLGFVRTLRVLRGLWSAVPQLSTLGMVLGAVSLLALAAPMTWRRLRSRAAATTRPRPTATGVGSWRAAALVGGVMTLASLGGCATTTPRAHSPAALCSDLTLDHRSLYCANHLPRSSATR